MKMNKLNDNEKDKQFILEMAEHVWQKVKGIKIPDSYSEEDRLHIFERYWHRAVEKENLPEDE